VIAELNIEVRIAPAFKDAKVILPFDMVIGEKTVRNILELPMDRFVAYMERLKEKKGGESDAEPIG